MTDFTILSGASLSNALLLSGAIPVGIITPAAWTAANITLQISRDGTIYNDVYDDAGSEVVVTAAAARFILFANATKFLCVGPSCLVKLRSGTAGLPVNQGADRTIGLITG